jgi:tRNA nucleotidyltransferase (CCA-adding enzyme)
MKTYLVGGAVRDELLGLPIKDRDFVVVGARQEELLNLGFSQVGQDFPVFLHPKSKEEYALARKERKIGPGHQGFTFDSCENVSLQEDLSRRDLTINAIAKKNNGKLIDPFNGVADLREKVLRHVSPAFVEDPLRVLRVARFYARFAALGFSIANETLCLMREITESGELLSLSAERVWQEVSRALSEKCAPAFFDCLRKVGALKVLMPELDRLFGVPQTKKWHPEVDTGVHTLMVLKAACLLSEDVSVRFAALTHDLGKGLTPMGEWPSHKGHDVAGLNPLRELCTRLKVPKKTVLLAKLSCQYHTQIHRVKECKEIALLRLIERLDPFRAPERFSELLLTLVSDARGRLGCEAENYPQKDYLEQAVKVLNELELKDVIENAKNENRDIANAIRRTRLAALKSFIEENNE